MCLVESSAKGALTPLAIKLMPAANNGGFYEETGHLGRLFYFNLNTIEFTLKFEPKVQELTD